MSTPAISLRPVTANATTAAQIALAAGGAIVVYNALNNEVYRYTLASPAWAAPTDGASDLAGAPLVSTECIEAGPATHYTVVSAANTKLWDGTVGTSDANMIMADPACSVGQQFTLVSLAHTA